MLNFLFLIAIILGVSGQNISQKPYTKKTSGKGVYLFSALVSAAAVLFFVFTSKGFNFNHLILPYSIGFAISYALCTVFTVTAISCGSLSLTSLFISYSLLLPTFYGVIFLGDKLGTGFIPGIFLLILSLLLINMKTGNNEKSKISLKWIISIIIAFVGNGMCSIIQKNQQLKFQGEFKNEFMIVSLLIVTVTLLIFSFLKESDNIKFYAKSAFVPALICGGLNGLVNLFVMILSGRMPVSLMFPLISAGEIIITYIVSKFVYKEKLTKIQFVGFLLGIGSVVFLNI